MSEKSRSTEDPAPARFPRIDPHRNGNGASGEGISVVVPTLNESERIASFLGQLRKGCPREIIVVDGGSQDGTAEIAMELADRVLTQPGGLARQINRGAAACAGAVLFFPYADTKLPGSWPQDIESVIRRPHVVGGAFRLAFDSRKAQYRFIAWCANLRTFLRVGPLGDQAIFTRREVFLRLGGYRADSLLEDLDFVRRLRRSGRVCILPREVRSSVRRWEQNGMLSTAFQNWGYLIADLVGLKSANRRGAYRRYRARTR